MPRGTTGNGEFPDRYALDWENDALQKRREYKRVQNSVSITLTFRAVLKHLYSGYLWQLPEMNRQSTLSRNRKFSFTRIASRRREEQYSTLEKTRRHFAFVYLCMWRKY